MVSTKYLGGATTARDHRGDPDARPAFTTVPAERQREALRFVAEAGFGERAWAFRPDLLSRLAPERWRHWGSPGATARADFPVHDWALTQQRSLLARLLDPVVLSRIRDAELRALPGEPTARNPRGLRDAHAVGLGRAGHPGGLETGPRPQHPLGPARRPAAPSERHDRPPRRAPCGHARGRSLPGPCHAGGARPRAGRMRWRRTARIWTPTPAPIWRTPASGSRGPSMRR